MSSSLSLDIWQTSRARLLDELEIAHQSVGGSGKGRRFATQQLNRAYAVLLAAQFQGFCAQFHNECVSAILSAVGRPAIVGVVRTNLLFGRTMDRGNAGPGNVGNDFSRLGVSLWDDLYGLDARNRERNRKIELLNKWRNAIAHDDFRNAGLFAQGRSTVLRISAVRDWRSACNRVALDMDRSMRNYLLQLLGKSPW